MHYEPTEAELNGLSGDEMAADEAQAAFYEQQEEWERQAHYHHEQEQEAWEEGEYEQMIFEVEGYKRPASSILSPGAAPAGRPPKTAFVMPKTATSYQPHLLDPHSAQPQPVSPKNGRSFKLAELYQLLDCRLVDVIRLTPELILIIDDEGKFRNPAYLNLLATYLWYQHQPEARGQDSIVGRAVLCHDKQFK